MNAWKLYSWVWLILYATMVEAESISRITINSIYFLGCIGVVLFAYKKKIFKPLFWQLVTLVIIGDSIISKITNIPESFLVELLAFCMLLPAYYALVCYSFGNDIFKSKETKTHCTS
jgi:hypothetical protein